MLNLVVSVILGYIPGCFQRIHTLLHTAFKSFFRCLSAAASVTLLQPSTLQRRPSPWRRQNFPEESRAALGHPPYRQGVEADLGFLPSPPSTGKKKKKKATRISGTGTVSHVTTAVALIVRYGSIPGTWCTIMIALVPGM